VRDRPGSQKTYPGRRGAGTVNRETTLTVLALALLAAAVVAVAAVPGALADPREPADRPGDVRIVDVAVSPGEVTGETAELRLATALRHGGGPVENVTVRYRAFGADSGLLVAERRVGLGTVAADGELTANGSLVVPRRGGYRLEVVAFAGNERVAATTTSVRGVAALTPPYADRDVEFGGGRLWPTVTVAVEEVTDGRARLRIATAVTNRGDERSDDLRLRVLLRQAESNVVADEAETTVGGIRPGRTETVAVTVAVPDGYNYVIDAALSADGVLIDETRSVADLDPEETIDVNETRREVEFETGDFAGDGGGGGDGAGGSPEPEPAPEDAGADAPGFGIAVALAALLAAALAARRAR